MASRRTGRKLAYAAERLHPSRETRGIVLAGAAGVGKTRLARELLERHRATGGETRLVIATAATGALPLGAFLSILDLHPGDEPTTSSLFSQAVAELRETAAASDLLLVVDDAHLLDGMSGAVVHQLVLAGVPVVLTLRSGAASGDAITSLWKDGVLDRLEIQALARADVESLLTAVLGGPPESSTLERIWQASGGNAMLVRELVTSVQRLASPRRPSGPGSLRSGPRPGRCA
jgi:AAA domain